MNKIHLGIVAVILMLGLTVVGHAQILSVTNGLTLQLKADGTLFSDQAGTTPVSDGSTVGKWINAVSGISGSDPNASDTGFVQPTFHTGVLNGHPVVRFDGTNDFLATSAVLSSFFGASAWTTFAVFQARSITNSPIPDSGYENAAIWMDNAGNEGMVLKMSGSTPKVMSYAGAVASQTFALNQFTFAVDSFGGGKVSIQSAGAGSGTTGTVTSAAGASTVNSSFLVLGKNYQPAHYFFDGDVAEILMYDRTLTSLEMDSVTSYLDTKYALGLGTIPEPSTIALVCGAGLAFLGLRRRRA